MPSSIQITDPRTGYLETSGDFAHAFTAERKEAFLKNYKANGIRIRRACRELGLSEETVSRHLKADPLFREHFEAVEHDYIEELEATSRQNALNPRSVIERIFQLKCLLPLKYGQENKPMALNVSIALDGKMLESSRKRDEVIEGQLVQPQQMDGPKDAL